MKKVSLVAVMLPVFLVAGWTAAIITRCVVSPNISDREALQLVKDRINETGLQMSTINALLVIPEYSTYAYNAAVSGWIVRRSSSIWGDRIDIEFPSAAVALSRKDEIGEAYVRCSIQCGELYPKDDCVYKSR